MHINRIILFVFALFLIIPCYSQLKDDADSTDFIYTVHGEMDINELGVSLTHEHVMSRFGLDPVYIGEYDKESLFAQVIPYLKEVKALGINTIFDCTAAYFGRNVSLLKEISDSTGVEIITNTGFYGAASDKYVPESAIESSIEDISKIWIDEFENGINGTGIKPGFIKLAFDNGTSELDLKLFTAGILTHLSTGLTMAVHTENNLAAVEKQLKLMEEYEVSPTAWVWVHASKASDTDILIETAKKGGWISLDKFKAAEAQAYVTRIKAFKEQGLLDKVLISHDGNSYNRDGELRGYQAIMTHLVPALKESGFSDDEINQVLVINPRNAFKIGIRKESQQINDSSASFNEAFLYSDYGLKAFPNPFNQSTRIQINLMDNSMIDLSVYDQAGRKVKTIVRDQRPAGSSSFNLPGSDLEGGNYYLILKTETGMARQLISIIR